MSRNSDWNLENPEGCCSGQLFAVVVMGGAATPKGVFAALTPRAGALASGQATGRAQAVRCAGSGRAPGYVSRGRVIIPIVSSRRCCQRGHAQHHCQWSKPPRWAPAEAGAAPS
eukprot:scaffold1487_cov116-Isochrysis_galbana.AAC.12